jgi:RNA polymerase sigma-70 factor, ECF subfamily
VPPAKRKVTPSLTEEAGMRAAYTAHGAELFGFAYRRLGDRQSAEDAVQETFIRAWQAADRFDPQAGTLRGWLFAILRNVSIDQLRARASRPQAAEVDVTDVQMPYDATDGLLAGWQMEEALRRLNPIHREVIVETILLDRPYAEVAERAGVPEGTLRSRLYYGLRALRVALDEMGWDR